MNFAWIGAAHPEDDRLESYLLHQLAGADLDELEDHLLLCHSCQMRAIECQDYVRAMKNACRRLRDQPGPERLAKLLARNVFVSHAGSQAGLVRELRGLLEALGFVPVVAMELPSLGKPVYTKILRCMKICRSAIVVATPELMGRKRGTVRANVLHEIGMLQNLPNIGNRIVYLKHERAEFPSNFRDRAWIPFETARMSECFVPLLKELRSFSC